MESKVILFDSNNNRVGETYTRRARQLVKQQRASWVGEGHDAIRFAPGMEKMDDPANDDIHGHMPHSTSADDELMKLAKRRVHARFAFRLHCAIALAISALVVFIYLLTDPGGYFWPMWPMLSLGFSVTIHGVIYKIINGEDMEYKIAREYERLKYRHSYHSEDDRRI